MLTLDNNSISLLSSLINKELQCLSSDNMNVYSDSITFLTRNLKIEIKNNDFNFDLFIQSDWYEMEESAEVYHDFRISLESLFLNDVKTVHRIKTEKIQKIEILGRYLSQSDIDELLNDNLIIYNKYVENIFIFYFYDARQLIIEFDSFFPSIEMYLNRNAFMLGFKEKAHKYFVTRIIE